MIRKYISLALLFLLSDQAISSHAGKTFSKESVLPSEEVVDCVVQGVKDCTAIGCAFTSRQRLCALTLNYYEMCLPLHQLKESLFPETYRTFKPQSSKYIVLMQPNGTIVCKVSPSNLQEKIFNDEKTYTNIQLQQIALGMVYKYFSLQCHINYLMQGAQNLCDFSDYSKAERITEHYRLECAKEDLKAGRAITDLGSNEELVAALITDHTRYENQSSSMFFSLLMGLPPTYFIQCYPDKNDFLLPELDFQDAEPDGADIIYKAMCYQALQISRLASFKMRISLTEMDVVAPLDDPQYRRNFFKQQHEHGYLARVDDKGILHTDQDPPEERKDEPIRLTQARYALRAAQLGIQTDLVPLAEEIESLKKKIAGLEETNAAKQRQINLLQADLAKKQVLEEVAAEADKKSQKTKAVTNQSDQTAALKAKRQEIQKLQEQIKTIKATVAQKDEAIKEKDKAIKELKVSLSKLMKQQESLLQAQNTSTDTIRILGQETKDQRARLDAMETRVAESVSRHQELNTTIGQLEETAQSLRAMNRLLAGSNDNAREKLLHAKSRHIDPLSAALFKASQELEAAEQKCLELEDRNEQLVLALAQATGTDNNSVLISNALLESDNRALEEQNSMSQSQLTEMRLQNLLSITREQTLTKALDDKALVEERLKEDNTLLAAQRNDYARQLVALSNQLAEERALRLRAEQELMQQTQPKSKPKNRNWNGNKNGNGKRYANTNGNGNGNKTKAEGSSK